MEFFLIFNNFVNKNGYNFDEVSKLATPGILKLKILQNKGYKVIIPDYDVTNKILSRDSNDIVDVVM